MTGRQITNQLVMAQLKVHNPIWAERVAIALQKAGA